MIPTPDFLLDLFRRQKGKPLSGRQVLAHFDLDRKERQETLALLDALVEEGLLRRARKGHYLAARSGQVVTGIVSVHRDGYGFVAPEQGQGPDVFIPARYLRGVMNGDRVAIQVGPAPRGGVQGQVVRVLNRAHQQLLGRLQEGGRHGMVIPSDPALSFAIPLAAPPPDKALPGFLVLVRIDRYPDRTGGPLGTVVEVLGDPADPQVEILAIAHKFDLPHRFSRQVEDLARQIPQVVTAAECQGRTDLRQLDIVTIDGETAKDFDDAVAVKREERGTIRLWVAIADVGHYVPEGGPIDVEALERATSVYFPGACLPMLPETLSNGICSLRPDEDRLALVAEMLFSGDGRRLEARFYPAVMRSCARLTYREVAAALEDRLDADSPLVLRRDQFQVMAELAERLMAMRRRRGSLDFDLPEPEIVLDLQGRPDQILRSERTLAHRIIEEFMLAANEAVAGFLADREIPLLYRIHEPPELEKLQRFQEFLSHFNIGLELQDDTVNPRELQAVLDRVSGHPEERMVNQLLLRSMRQARYSEDNAGHFGLAADCYCHFTSPIRRYPDLVVHRILRQALSEEGVSARFKQNLERNLPGLGEVTSQRERRAMEAERDSVALKRCQFMEDKIGEEFEALVADVQPFGFFVELIDVFVEGLVHVSSLDDDYYEFEEHLHRLVGQRRRRLFRIGDAVRVKLVRVNLDRRELDFELM